MTPFTALDEILNAGAITPATSRAVTASGSEAQFQPLFAKSLTATEGGHAVTESHGEPQIEVVQEDGRVRQIVVTCRCGERTVLDCAY